MQEGGLVMDLKQRLHTLVGSGLAMAMLACGTTAFGQAQTYELKATHFLPPNHSFHKELLRWSEELSKKSNGRLVIKVFPSGQMGPTPRQFDLVRTGVADIGVGLTGATPGRFPMTEVSNLPFVVTDSETASKRITELAPKYLGKEFEGVKLLQLTITPPLKFHMAKTRLNTLADFKGQRIRYAGELFAESVKAFGGTPVAVAPGETVDAMSKGTVDGCLFPFEGAQSFQIATVAKYSYEPGVNAASFFWVMNPASYEKLPADLRALIDQTSGPATAERIGKQLDDAEVEGRAYMTSKGVDVSKFAASLQEQMRTATKPLIDDHIGKLEAKGQPGRAFYDALTKGGA
jgi:TRAP-type C4-dicarboxylate transport system substrate-binding protein